MVTTNSDDIILCEMTENQPLLGARHDPEARLTAEDAASHGKTGRRERLAELLESRICHQFVISLITIDAICVLIDVGYSFLSESCTPGEGPEAPAWLEILAHISIAITTFFLIEIPVTLFAFGTSFYNPVSGVHHASLHLFDVLVILTTFVLEVVLRGRERELAALLIIFRLWRLVKLVGGVAVGAGELEEQTAKELDGTKKKLAETESALAQALKENGELRKKLSTNNPGSSTS